MAAESACVLAISGGVGGAKLALGLADLLGPGQLHVMVNTGDDFEHLGLPISPDVDTLLYTLSGLANPDAGWGVAGETWHTMDALERLGGEAWFRLGDRDMATHLWRRQKLAEGLSLSEVVSGLAQRLGVAAQVYPMSDDPVRTVAHTREGDLSFQHYFVRDKCQPEVSGFSFEGVSAARPNRVILHSLQEKQFSNIVICPSNPFVSIDPILQIPGMWPALRDSGVPVVLVSPIVAGLALKGPAAKMMTELGRPVTAAGIAEHYSKRYPNLVDYLVIDESDAALVPDIQALGLEAAVASTIMSNIEDKRRLARFTLEIGGRGK